MKKSEFINRMNISHTALWLLAEEAGVKWDPERPIELPEMCAISDGYDIAHIDSTESLTKKQAIEGARLLNAIPKIREILVEAVVTNTLACFQDSCMDIQDLLNGE